MVNIRQRFLGRADGNFNPHQVSSRDFLERMAHSFCSRPDDPDNILIPDCDDTNRVVLLGKENSQLGPKCMTTRNQADGVVIDDIYVAGVIMNADAPVVRIFEPGKTRFAVLRGAFRCLMPMKDSFNKRSRGIIRVAFEDFQFNPKEVQVWAGMGVGPCCYGAEHWPEMNDQSVDIPIGKATRGARKGKKSIDLFELIKKQLLALKVEEANIRIDAECTCCKGYFLGPSYYSNCRSGPSTGRNAIGFWMT